MSRTIKIFNMKSEIFDKIFNDALKTGNSVVVSKELIHLIPNEYNEENDSVIEILGSNYSESDLNIAITNYSEGVKDENLKKALLQLLNDDYQTKLNFILANEYNFNSGNNDITNEGILGKICELVCKPVSKKITEKVCEIIDGKTVCRVVTRIVVETSCKTLCKFIPI